MSSGKATAFSPAIVKIYEYVRIVSLDCNHASKQPKRTHLKMGVLTVTEFFTKVYFQILNSHLLRCAYILSL